MHLCTLCQSLDLLNAPKLPESCNTYNAQNESPALISVFKRQKLRTDTEKKSHATETTDNEPLGIPFHENLSGLRVAAKACSVCKIVAQDVVEFQTAFNARENEEQQRKMGEKGPDWKMYLAKGVNEISGFLVVAHDAENKSVVWVVSAVGLSAGDEDPLAAIVAGREIDADASSDMTVKRAAKWAEECDTKHSCKKDNTNLPTRVLDVKDGAVTLYTSNGGKGKYVALSYVGDTDSAHKEEVIKDDLDTKSVPQTFQDAITMTRGLGLRYLWIEALCNDLPRSSPAYASIFSHAYVTLSAISSPSPTQGMLTPRSPPTYTSFPYTHASTTGTLCASPLNKEQSLYPSNDRILYGEPLSQDPWALQERLFSPRILHVTSTQLSFECNTHFLSETGFSMSDRTDTLDPSTRTFKSDIANETQKKGALWQNVLEMYCRRPLANPEDKLPALSNIAHTLSNEGDTYVAGLWRSRLISELIWQATGFAKGRTRDSTVYRAPSWSWASIDGPFGTFTPGYGFDKGEWQDVAQILECKVTLKNEEEPFGKVSDAWIKIRAPLEELKPCEEEPRKQVWKMKTRSGDEEGRIVILDTLARAEKAKEGKLYALVLMKSDTTYHAVVVAPVEGREGVYTRVGKVLFDEETLGRCGWMGDEGEKVDVVLV